VDPRATARLGGSDVVVTRLGLGTAPIGNLYRPVSDAEAVAVVARALELGIRFIDTAPLYGNGLAESRLGAALAGVPRGAYALATKVGRLLVPGAERDPGQLDDGQTIYRETPGLAPVFDFSAAGARRSLEESLSRLGLDRVDVLHVHDPDDHPGEALGGAFRALDQLRAAGVVGAIGAGMNQAPMLVRFAREARPDCFLLAGRYTLLDQSGLDELLPLCAERGISVIAGGVYNSGLLADPRPGAPYDYVPAPAALVERAQAIGVVCARHGVPLKAAAIQFPLGHPAVTTVLTGCQSVAEVEENVAMFEHPIPAALWADLRTAGLLAERVPVPGP
jgi:D-threo-aldose 1-dehydrogenase